MAERFTITVDGEDHELTEQNHTVAMFRHTPEYDYLHLIPERLEDDEEQRHILIFRHQYLCHWLANLALNGPDRRGLDDMTAELGSFRGLYGFNSRVMLEDKANDFEIDFYMDGLMGDLRAADGVPEEFLDEPDS